ncbi:MAG: hypothetical protein ACRCYQ_13685 [Nocardioides sp.]
MTSTAPKVASRPTVSERQRWLLALASVWMIAGLQTDAWAHANIPELETFWTVWHGVMYSGMTVCLAVLAWLVGPHLLSGDLSPRSILELPRPLLVPVAGMGLLAVSGAIDTGWHNIFGIEDELDIFISPSHTGLIVGMVLVAIGPVLLRWAEPDNGRLNGSDRALVVLCLVIAAMPVHIYTNHATALGFPAVGTGLEPMPIAGQDASWLHGYALSTILLLVPVVLWPLRWHVPWGVPTVLVSVPGLLVWVTLGGMVLPWFAVGFCAGVVLAETACRVGAAALGGRVHADLSWFVGGAMAAFLTWGVTLVACALLMPAAIDPVAAVDYESSLDYDGDGLVDVVRYGWSIHATTGILLMVALIGGSTATAVRRLVRSSGTPPSRRPA